MLEHVIEQQSERRLLVAGIIDADLHERLFDPGSLTERMRSACDGKFAVRIVEQGFSKPTVTESRLLHIKPGRYALVREVQLTCNGQPWVFARSVIPATTLTGKQRRLGHMGTRPLGAALFADPSMRREPPMILRLERGSRLHRHAVRGLPAVNETIWGRSSRFIVGGKPLLVCEYFLPSWGCCG